MSSHQRNADLVKVVRHFLTENMDTEEASKTLSFVGYEAIISEIRENWTYFVEENNLKLEEIDVTDEDLKQVILDVTHSLAAEI